MRRSWLRSTAAALCPMRAALKPKVILEMMRETGTTVMLGVPTLYALLRDDIEQRILGASRSQLRSSLAEPASGSRGRGSGRSIARSGMVFLRVRRRWVDAYGSW